jgi:hypothetical protein
VLDIAVSEYTLELSARVNPFNTPVDPELVCRFTAYT